MEGSVHRLNRVVNLDNKCFNKVCVCVCVDKD